MVLKKQFSFGHKEYQFNFKLNFFFLCLFLFLLCCWLGIWQLHRYHFKENLLATYKRNISAEPQVFSMLKNTPASQLQFQKVLVKGHYREDLTFLIENQMQQNKRGFEVITPFEMNNEKKLLLVDRGWIGSANESSGYLSFNHEMQTIEGYIKLLNEYQFILGKNILSNGKPLVMQKIDIKELTTKTQKNYFPYLVRLTLPSASLITTITPARHLGYVVQWFVLALIVLLGYVFFCCEPLGDKNGH